LCIGSNFVTVTFLLPKARRNAHDQVVRLNGRIAPGEKVTVYPEVNPNRGFAVTPQPNGTVRFDMREEYTGPLAGMIFKSIPDLAPSFARFAAGLKHRVEGSG
jgi:hypothetical protein